MPELVVRAVRATFARCAVVGDQHNDGVVELTLCLQMVEQTTDLRIGVAHHGGEHLHHPCVQALMIGLEVVPGRHPGRAFGEHHGLLDDAELLLPFEYVAAPGVPATIESAAVDLQPLRRSLMGRMRRGAGVPHEERPIGVRQPMLTVVLDRCPGQVGVEVVALLG